MDNKLTVKLSSLAAYESVEDFILKLCPISRSQLKKQKLNKKFLQMPLDKAKELELSADILNYGFIQRSEDNRKLSLIYEDELIIAFSKPEGLHSHPHSYGETDNTLSILFNQISILDKVNSSSYDRGLLYRLDYGTSGLMLFAKSEDLYKKVRENFSNIFKSKVYVAIVKGKIQERFAIKSHLKASGKKGRKQVLSSGEVNASLQGERLSYNSEKDFSLVKIYLETGLRHQIRVQLSSDGHPIVGDDLYGGPSAERLYLHCFQYEFELEGRDYSLKDENLKSFKLFFDLNSEL